MVDDRRGLLEAGRRFLSLQNTILEKNTMTLFIRFLAASSATVAIGAALPAQGRVHTVHPGKGQCGAAWVLDVSAGGSVEEQLEIAAGLNGCENALDSGGEFGSSGCGS